MKTVERLMQVVLSGALVFSPVGAGAQQAALYELTENAKVSMTGGLYGRHAYAALQGWAKVGTPVCPPAVLLLNPGAKTCTITAIGTDVIDLASGKGTVSGTWATVVQLDNAVDAPEAVVLSGSFTGNIDLSLAINKVAPLGFVTDGKFTLDGSHGSLGFSGTFRLPFALQQGRRVTPLQNQDAYYLDDRGMPFPVTLNERALGWPTVRLELKFE